MRQSGIGFGVALCAPFAAGQPERPEISPRITMVRKIDGAQFYGVSPDGRLLCLYRFRRPETMLREWSYDGGNSRKTEDVLQIVDLETGKLHYATQLRTMVEDLSFFAGGERIYAQTVLMGRPGSDRLKIRQQVVIDLRTRQVAERLSESPDFHIALSGDTLLGYRSYQGVYSVRHVDSPRSALLLAELPDYKEVARTPFAVAPEPEHYGVPRPFGDGMHWGYDTTPIVSGNKERVVYGAGHHLVCRRTSDLSVTWSRLIEPEYFGVWLVAITPDAKTVAAAVIGGSSVAGREKHYIGIYGGEDGAEQVRLSLDGYAGMSISPDGKLLAVSAQTPLPEGRAEPTVLIYDIPSGRQVGRVNDPVVGVSGFGNSGKAAIGSQFTPDGSYLITSGLNDLTVWSIQR
ncbi:MAG TPA: hypothetical protein VE999_13985 [Gemmataceae bacterium]|nr:hypothetical protein [Gemmataceae bacterium]